MESEPTLFVESLANDFGRRALAVLVEAEAQYVREAEHDARGRAVFERDHLLAAVAVEARRQAVRSFDVGNERGVLLAREQGLGVEIVLQRVERDALYLLLDLRAQVPVERRVEREQELELRVGAQARRLVEVYAAAVRDEVEDGSTEEVVYVAEAREREDVARNVFDDAVRHLALLRVHTVAEVNEQRRNLRVVEAVERERYQLDLSRALHAFGDSVARRVEVASLNVAVPVRESRVVPGAGDV